MGKARWQTIAFLASAAAAGVHVAAAHEHFHEYLPAGLFMLAAGVLQLAWAVWVSRGAGRPVLLAGAAANAGIAAVWLVSRTTGLPWGEKPWASEHIDGPDLLATALEALIVVAAVRLLTGEAPAPRSLLHVAWVGALTACTLSAHDPAREQLTAFATIAGAFALRAFALRAFVAAAPGAIASHNERSDHEEVTYRGGIRARRAIDPRPGLDASR